MILVSEIQLLGFSEILRKYDDNIIFRVHPSVTTRDAQYFIPRSDGTVSHRAPSSPHP